MDPQQKTAAPAVAGYIPEYSETPHSGSFDIAQHGLSSDDVARLTAEGRVNTQNNKSSRTLWSIMRAHLFTVFNFVLGACGAVVIMYQRWADLLFLGAVIANVVIGFVQEYKAKLELDRISLLDRSPATAVRDGKSVEVPMEQLVEGDVVILKRGDQVPADAVVLTSDSLELDESLLTGENDPIAKRPGDMVLSASSVLGGTGRVLLSHVGANSRASKISDEARQFSRIQSELRDALNRVVRWITVGLAVIIPVVSSVALSGGESGRAHLARVFAQQTPLILLDEPTAALDITHQEQTLRVSRELAAEGAAVLTVLHDLDVAAAYSDRMVLLRGGEVVASGAPEQVCSAELLSEVYQHPIEVLRHPVTNRLLILPER
ncbi:P-type ATPase%2C translocating [Mycobacterium tuberculosis]|nr:P-type ATPase%2C translocating [Mycobacterium tuberculosis]